MSMTLNNQPDMTAEDVFVLMKLFEENQIEVIIDGGWGVDALLGEQTRSHADLDIAMPHKYVPQIRAILELRGYKDVLRDDTRECNFVLGDELGHLVDIHTYTFDAQGNLIFGIPYPFDSLTGHGSIGGYPVRCISPEWLVKFHTGYKLDENDNHDVKALCLCFGIEKPAEYNEFEDVGVIK
jgi:lincosamide nucleotidyltransferase A/C/D/E